MSITTLPSALLKVVASFLDRKERQMHIPLVNKAFNRICGDALFFLRELTKLDNDTINFYTKKKYTINLLIQSINTYKVLKELYVTDYMLPEMSLLSSLPALIIDTVTPGRHRSLPAGLSDDQVSEGFPKEADLRTLTLNGYKTITAQGVVQIIPFCRNLQNLCLSHIHGTPPDQDHMLQIIGNTCKQLEKLKLRNLQCTDKGIQDLASRCALLEDVELYMLSRITDAGITTLVQCCPNIISIELKHNFKTSANSVAAIAHNLPNIREIFVNFGMTAMQNSTHEIHNAILQNIGTCHQLEKIQLSCMLCSDEGIQSLASGCPSLNFVLFDIFPNITDTGITSLVKNCPKITRIEIGNCAQITGQSLVAIAENLGRLEAITLWLPDDEDGNEIDTGVADEHLRTLYEKHPSATFCSSRQMEKRYKGIANAITTERKQNGSMDLSS